MPPPHSDTTLLAVAGKSPAILTETIWALAHEPTPIIPTRVIAITTLPGKKAIEEWLFTPLLRFNQQSPWEALRATLLEEGHNLDGKLRFGTTGDDIRVLTSVDPATARSRELGDIRTPADNDAVADFILENVRSIVENPDTQLIASIAGGRKTMGALLYACMTLAAREDDRLTHVLVTEPYEMLREFYFPGQPGGDLPDREGTSHHPGAALLDLADVPFVALRNLFVRELGRKAGSFARLTESCREGIRKQTADSLRVTIDPQRLEMEINGLDIRLAPTEMLLILFLAERAKQGESSYVAYKDAVDDLNAFRESCRAKRGEWARADSLHAVWEDREVNKYVSSIRQKLRQRGGDAALLATSLPAKGRCSLEVPGPLIHIKE